MKHILPAILLVGLATIAGFAAQPEQFNVVWNSHSKISRGSMPAGNGEIKDLVVTPESRRKDVEIRPAQ